MDNINMTEEQKKFLEECEIEFKDRYTEKDNDFMKIKNMVQKSPPIMDPWYNKSHNWPGNKRKHYNDRDGNNRNHRYMRYSDSRHRHHRH